MIIRGGNIYYQNNFVQNHEIIINDEVITDIHPSSTKALAEITLKESDLLVPGFTDLHIHGAKGHDVMDGSIGSLQAIADALLCEGVTGFLATTMTEATDTIEAALTACAEFKKNQQHGAELLGVHLEGPFLSKEYMGAQSGKYLQAPNSKLLESWLTRFPNLIKLITLAPELPNAMEFIKLARSQNIIVSIGHTAADFAMTRQAIDAGAHYATHLYNAMSGIHHRTPGAAAAILCDQRVTAELIVDGVHVAPEMIEFTVKCKGLDHLVLITDAMRAKCLKAGVYDLGGQNVIVDDSGTACLERNGKLAGSTLRLNQALKNLQNFTQLPLTELLPLVTTQPLKILGINNQGEIAQGQLANLTVLDQNLNIKGTYYHGKLCYEGAL